MKMKGHHPSSILQPTTCGNPAKNRDSWITTSHILETGINVVKPRIKHPHLGLVGYTWYTWYTWYTSIILYLA